MPSPRRLPAGHGSGVASRYILVGRKQPREVLLHSNFCIREFPAIVGAFARNNSTLRRYRKRHWPPYFRVKRAAHRRRAMVRPNVFPTFLGAWIKNVPLAI